VGSEQPGRSNPSLGYASSELLRRVNIELGHVDRRAYFTVVRHHLARNILGPRTPQERPLALDRQGAELAARWNRKVRQAITASGVRVVGTLDDLPVAPDRAAAPSVPPPTDEELLDAAGTARAGLAALLERLGGDGAADDRGGAERPAGGSGPDHDAVEAAVLEVTGLARKCIELSRRRAAVSPAASA
jgi:hypothetical protein